MPTFYLLTKILHIASIGVLLVATGAALQRANARAAGESAVAGRKLIAVVHGVSALLVVVTGTMLGIAAGHMSATSAGPIWIHVKFSAWLALVTVLPLAKRRPQLYRLLWVLVPVVLLLALYSVYVRPT